MQPVRWVSDGLTLSPQRCAEARFTVSPDERLPVVAHKRLASVRLHMDKPRDAIQIGARSENLVYFGLSLARGPILASSVSVEFSSKSTTHR